MDIPDACSGYPRTSLTVALMPWKETDSMKERVKFVLEWEKRWNAGHGLLNFAELCCRQCPPSEKRPTSPRKLAIRQLRLGNRFRARASASIHGMLERRQRLATAPRSGRQVS